MGRTPTAPDERLPEPLNEWRLLCSVCRSPLLYQRQERPRFPRHFFWCAVGPPTGDAAYPLQQSTRLSPSSWAVAAPVANSPAPSVATSTCGLGWPVDGQVA